MPGGDASFINGLHLINEIPVPFIFRIEIVPKRPVYKYVYHIAKRYEFLNFKGFQQQKKNILRATVVSAQPLVQEQIDKLTRGMEARRPGKTFLLTNQIDASLIAGFRMTW